MWWPFLAENLRGVTAIFSEETFSIDIRGSQDFKLNGLQLHIPEGVLPAKYTGGYEVDIKTGLVGEFQFPDNSELVSCIYWLSCSQQFLKPVTLQIQHCASIEDLSQLHFVVAKSSQSELPYKFEVLEKGTFSQHNSYGSIDISQFSFFAIIICKIFRSHISYYSALYFFYQGVKSWRVDVVVTRNLEIHLQVRCIHVALSVCN